MKNRLIVAGTLGFLLIVSAAGCGASASSPTPMAGGPPAITLESTATPAPPTATPTPATSRQEVLKFLNDLNTLAARSMIQALQEVWPDMRRAS